jgi:hypothetical protein
MKIMFIINLLCTMLVLKERSHMENKFYYLTHLETLNSSLQTVIIFSDKILF